jgi:hypothetical protein
VPSNGVFGSLVSEFGAQHASTTDAATLTALWHIDPVTLAVGIAASITALFVAGLRPIGVFALVAIVLMAAPWSAAQPWDAVLLIPYFAVATAGVSEVVLRKHRSLTYANSATILSWGLAALAALAIAVPTWSGEFVRLISVDSNAAANQAEAWVADNVAHDSRLVVDGSTRSALIGDGFSPARVASYATISVTWKQNDYVVVSPDMRSSLAVFPIVMTAMRNSVVVAQFGSGSERVQVQQVDPDGIRSAREAINSAVRADVVADAALLANPELRVGATAHAQLELGLVDSRVAVVIGQLLANGPVTVDAFPRVAGDTRPTLRQVVISAFGRTPARGDSSGSRALASALARAAVPYRPLSTSQTVMGLQVRFAALPTLPPPSR